MTTIVMILTAILCLPLVLYGWVLAAAIRLLWGEKLVWNGPVLVVTLKADSWPMRTWYKRWGGTCFGYGVMLSPSELSLAHELEHTEQLQAGAIAGLVIGIVCAAVSEPFVGVFAWAFTPLLNYLAASLIALLNRKNGYRDNLFERAARDATRDDA